MPIGWRRSRVGRSGTLSEAQAREFAPAIEAYFKGKSKHLGKFDTFTVEWGKCDVQSMVAPDLKAEDYVRMLS